MEISQDQLRNYFPNLAGKSWKLTSEEIEERYKSNSKDVSKIVDKFLLGKQSLIIEETDMMVKDAVQALAKNGDETIGRQMSLVNKFEEEAKVDIGKLFQDLSNNKELENAYSLDKLCKKETAKIQQKWLGREYKPLNELYEKLFGKVEDQIRKVIKDLLPLEVKRREEEKEKIAIAERVAIAEKEAKPQAGTSTDPGSSGGGGGGGEKGGEGGGGGGGGSDGGVGAGEGPGSLPAVIIDINFYTSGMVNIHIDFRHTDRPPYDLNLESNQVADITKVKSEFDSYLKQVIEQGILKVYIFTRVFHDGVPYGIVFNLRESIREAAKTLKDSRKNNHLEIFWYDGRFKKGEEITSQIRDRSNPLNIK